MRALIDRKGETFAYIRGGRLFTLDGEETGRIEGNYIVDLAGKRIWELVGDGVYALDGMETIGFLTTDRPDDDYN
ncbi:MAG TPA: hypothetical protein VLL52_23745 [Anaerolineae bacterium]|nr:hypothetical protein [Anaerolineae bacterium]